MVKSELIIRLSKKFPELTRNNVEKTVDTILREISKTLKQGRRVELRGLGAFSIRKHAARIARNPKTGKEVSLSERHAIYFRAGKELREKVNKQTE